MGSAIYSYELVPSKTFLLRKCIDWDMYITITKTCTYIVEHNGRVGFQDLKQCIDNALSLLAKNKIVVIDELQERRSL